MKAIVKREVSVFLCAIVLSIASALTVCADVTVYSPNFTFEGNWPTNQPLTSGDYVPSSPANIAAATEGATAFAIGEYGGPHKIVHLNDSRYGNSYSWITTSLTLSRDVDLGGIYGTVDMSFAGIAFSNATLHSVGAITFGRSAAAEYSDRIAGNMYIQITTTNSVAAITDISAAADSQWTTLGYITTSDVYEHMLTLTPAVNATGVRIVTQAGNCIDEIVVHEFSQPEIVYGSRAFIWSNSVGAAWSDGNNWTNGTSPNSIMDNVYITEEPLSVKTINNDTTYGILDGKGYQYGTLTVDSTIGDGSPVTFIGDPFYLWLSNIYTAGSLILSNKVDSYTWLNITGYGEITMAEWTGTTVTKPKITLDTGMQLNVEGTVSPEENALPPNPWLHLDASKTNTMTLTSAGGGTYYVQQWNDVSGNGRYAYAESPANRPTWKMTDGIAHLDFGILLFGNDGTYMNGKTLVWNEIATGIRTVFLIYSDVDESGDVQNILCPKDVTYISTSIGVPRNSFSMLQRPMPE